MASHAMQVVFEGRLAVAQFDVFAEVGWLEQRPEVQALCRAAEADGRITRERVQATLPGVGDRAADNIVRWATELGLCHRSGELTPLGEAVARTGDVPMPEQGVYRLWVVDHPLTGRRILHAERQAPERDHRFADIEPLPIEPERDRPFVSVVDNDTRLTLRDLPSNHGQAGCLIRADDSQVSVRWRWHMAEERDRWSLDGTLGPRRQAITPADESHGLALWKELEQLGREAAWSRGRWDPQDRVLRVRFDELAPADVERFVGDCAVDASPVRRFAVYGPGRISGVPLHPASAEDAARWADARLAKRLEDARPRTREAVRRLWADLVEETPLHPFSPALPAHDALVERHRDQPARFWALAAPVDLAPVAPTADVLGEMRVDAPAAVPVAGPKLVQLVHNARCSMADLLGRLAPPGSVRRVILCDRYVRGAANLRALGLLVRAAARLGGRVQVITDLHHDKAEPEAIESISGRPAKSYRAVFGAHRQAHPHDRYVIVEGAETVGWHLSNSPLDGRWPAGGEPDPDAPLRWRDLVAVRCAPEQWPAGLAAITGGAA